MVASPGKQNKATRKITKKVVKPKEKSKKVASKVIQEQLECSDQEDGSITFPNLKKGTRSRSTRSNVNANENDQLDQYEYRTTDLCKFIQAGEGNEYNNEFVHLDGMDGVEVTVPAGEESEFFGSESECDEIESQDTTICSDDNDDQYEKGEHSKINLREGAVTSTFPMENEAIQKYIQLAVDAQVNRWLSEIQREKDQEKGQETGNICDIAVNESKQLVTPNRENTNASSNVGGNRLIKSPSDTTIYAPAIMRGEPNDLNNLNRLGKNLNTELFREGGIQSIVDVVGGISLNESKTDSQDQNRKRQQQQEPAATPSMSRQHTRKDIEIQRADALTDKAILEAEKFCASVLAPKGKDENFLDFGPPQYIITEGVRLKRLFDNNDDFFHVTLHIDNNLKAKISKGEFVDLDKLLPQGDGLLKRFSGETKFQMYSNNGEMYWGPAPGQNKITSIRKWDQAFRMYVVIYTEFNPHRAFEIWQYVYTIHTAAQSHPWDNVYHYDVIFRYLME